jgi:hypothetical protein
MGGDVENSVSFTFEPFGQDQPYIVFIIVFLNLVKDNLAHVGS